MKGQMMHLPLTTHSILEYADRVFPDTEIVTYTQNFSRTSYTYRDLCRRARMLANALAGPLAVQPGDRVATFAWNNSQHMELYYGIPGMGAICHTINIRLSPEQIAYIINDAQNKVLFADASLVKILENIYPQIPSVTSFVVMNADESFSTTLPGVIHYEDLLQNQPATFDWFNGDENEACGLCYTSGTTAQPKGVLYSHRSTYLHAMALMQPNACAISSSDRVLLVVPQFHVMAWGFPFMCLLAGATVVLPSCHLQPASIIKILIREKITVANGVPSIWQGVYECLVNDPPTEKLLLREYFVGGSAIPVSLLDAFEKDFGIPGVHAWGMTETSPLGTVSRLTRQTSELSKENQLQVRAKQGLELPGVEIRCVTDQGLIAPRDGITVGEIEIRGNWIIDRYYKSALPANEGGWFRTGDVGTIDKYGYMMITDRKKDLVKSGGEWISSIALELMLMAHPSIKEACVIAIPDKKWIERPLACIVLKQNCTVSDNELRQFLLNHFAKYQVPDKFIGLASIPKTSVGKLDKKELRRRFAEGTLL